MGRADSFFPTWAEYRHRASRSHATELGRAGCHFRSALYGVVELTEVTSNSWPFLLWRRTCLGGLLTASRLCSWDGNREKVGTFTFFQPRVRRPQDKSRRVKTVRHLRTGLL